VCGVSASGKTHLASTLAGVSGMAHLSSDVVRKGLLGLAPTQRADASGYSAGWNRRTYERLGELAAREAAAGRGALVDSTFRRREDREAFRAGLGPAHAPVLFVECRAPVRVLRRRAQRRRDRPETSDATPAVAARQLREWEPLDEVGPDAHVVLRSDRPAEAIADDLLALLDERLRAGLVAPAAHEPAATPRQDPDARRRDAGAHRRALSPAASRLRTW
jgi:predicted kinase